MVPDPSIDRRTLLAGSGTVLLGGLVGTGLFAPTWLPDAVTDELLRISPEPPDHVWRPDVSDEHADEAVERLESTVRRARELTERVDTESVPEDLRFHLDGGDPSGGWLGSARDESDPHERLFAATYGMQFAGEAVGAARVALGEADPEALVERGDRLRETAAEVRDSFGDYPVSEPARDLGYVYVVERELAFGRLNSHRGGTFVGDVAPAEDYSDRDVISTWGSHVQAEQRLRNARYYRGLYREAIGDDARPRADALRDALAALTDAIDEFPTRAQMRTRIEDERGLAQETPYGAARWELLTLCYGGDFRVGFDDGGFRSGHTLQRVVEAARALLGRRAHAFALDELDVSPDDDGYDSGRTLRAKRRAMSRFRSVREAHDSPFAGVLAREAAALIRSGDVGVGRTWDDGEWPPWRDRVEATTYYLVGDGQLRALDEVFGTVLGAA